jgi:gliding motility-associated lipoprotein GldH
MMRTVLIATLLAATLMACDHSIVYEENKPVASAVWKENEPVKFEFEVADTNTLHNFYINLRNAENYPYSNIYVFVELEFPNGKKSTDTVECFLADPTGKWLGSGLGDIYDNRFLYQQRKQFPMVGRYRVNVFQGMRTADLAGVTDVGFRLTKAE